MIFIPEKTNLDEWLRALRVTMKMSNAPDHQENTDNEMMTIREPNETRLDAGDFGPLTLNSVGTANVRWAATVVNFDNSLAISQKT